VAVTEQLAFEEKANPMKKTSVLSLASALLTTTLVGFGQTNLEIISFQRQRNRETRLQFNAPAGQNCRLEVSINLTSWQREVTWLGTIATQARKPSSNNYWAPMRVSKPGSALGDEESLTGSLTVAT